MIIVIAMYIGEDDERDEHQLCIDDLQDVFSPLIKAADDWVELGLALGIKNVTLKGIKSKEKCDKACLREMLTYWLESSPSRTWSVICNGLRSDTVKQDALADTIIEEKYEGIDMCCYCSLWSDIKRIVVNAVHERGGKPRHNDCPGSYCFCCS